jgi:hypothetical protein
MYCPSCSAKVVLDQKFCRSCGFGLEKTAQSLSEQQHTDIAQNFQGQKDTLERLGLVALSIFGLGVAGFFLFIFGSKVMTLFIQGKILAAVGLLGLLIVLSFGLLSVLLFARAKEAGEAPTKRRYIQGEATRTSAAPPNLLPERHLEEVASVTDRTTELLFADRGTGAERHTAGRDESDRIKRSSQHGG